MELYSIASGSSGNCVCAGSDDCHVLIDAGVSGKRVEEGLNAVGLKAEEMRGILITHEHVDHVSGLGVISRRCELPIYATRGTIDAILQSGACGEIPAGLFHVVRAGEAFEVGDLLIEPFATSHDAAEPVAYKISSGGKSMAVVTDLGTYDDAIVEKIQNLDVLMLEANHDVRMLEAGPYPYRLKQRILSERGHLSNESSGRLLSEALHDHFGAVMLGHLSEKNNYPDLAFETVRLEVEMGESPYGGNDFPMYVARRDMPSEMIRF